MPDLSLEAEYGGIVAGIDEAGRGPWAGPVVASCVVLDINNIPQGINDSKKISKVKREKIFNQIKEKANVGIGIASVEEIDEFNILQATMKAMQRAYNSLKINADMVLVDGNKTPKFAVPSKSVIKGDSISLSIAAASIIAKVTRDNIMDHLANDFPQYGWDKNSGYGTKTHQEAIFKYGINEHHRKSFKPIAKILNAA